MNVDEKVFSERRRDKEMGKRIRVGVVGGSFCEVHIQGFRHCPEIEVVAICRRQKDLAKQMAQKYQIQRVYADFDEMIQSTDIDVVSLAVPHHLHCLMTLRALSQGKHVICEKPLALNLKEAEEMVKKAEEKRLIHMTVFNWRFVPAMACMKELIDQGEVGSVYHVSFNWLSNGRRDKESRYSWRFVQGEAGYGVLGDSGVHGIDLIHWMAGDFKEVVSNMSVYVPEHKTEEGKYRKTEVEDSCSFLGELVGGGQVIFHVSSVASCDSAIRLEMHGNQGVLGVHLFPRAGDYHGKLLGGKGETDLRKEIPIPERLTSDMKPIYENDSPRVLFFARFAQRLVKAVQTGQIPSPNFFDGLKVQRVLQALTNSWEERKWINLV